jgi:hypothetical protein
MISASFTQDGGRFSAEGVNTAAQQLARTPQHASRAIAELSMAVRCPEQRLAVPEATARISLAGTFVHGQARGGRCTHPLKHHSVQALREHQKSARQLCRQQSFKYTESDSSLAPADLSLPQV